MEQHAPAYLTAFGARMPQSHVRAVERILACRTETAGRVYYQCPQCDGWQMAPASCGHRACNACGHEKAMEWQKKQEARLLPVDYLLITFTVPSQFRSLFRSGQELCYDALFRTAAAVLMEIAADPAHLGGIIGMTGVLHTWTRDLRYHPHIHFIVPAGALRDGKWIEPKQTAAGRDFFLPVRVLSTVMRNRMLKTLPPQLTPAQRQSLPAGAWRQPWNVDIRRAGKGDTALGYLARYVQKTAIDSSRILRSDARGVTIAWTERKTGEKKQQLLTGNQFLQRFLQHVLPTGFTRVRHFGFLSAAAKKTYTAVQSALAARPASATKAAATPPASDEPAATAETATPLPHHCCPQCRVKMRFREYCRPGQSRPPGYRPRPPPGTLLQAPLPLSAA